MPTSKPQSIMCIPVSQITELQTLVQGSVAPLSTRNSQETAAILYLKLDFQGLIRCFGTPWDYLPNECQPHPYVLFNISHHTSPCALILRFPQKLQSKYTISLPIIGFRCLGPPLTQSGQIPNLYLMTKFKGRTVHCLKPERSGIKL